MKIAILGGGVACSDVGPRDPAEYKEELASIFSGWPKLVQMMIDHTPIERSNMAARGFAASLFNRDKKFCMTRNENSRNTDFDKIAAAMSRGWEKHLPLNA